MNRILIFLAALFCAQHACAQLPWWWVYAPKGPHVGGGPAPATPGALVVSPLETGFASTLSDVWGTLTNSTDALGNIVGPNGSQDKERAVIEAAIGQKTAGEDVGEIKTQIDPISLVRRKQMLEELKASPDAPKFNHFIAYFEALQAHEARYLLFVERANVLIKTHKRELTWQERVRLMSEVGLLNAQEALARQELTEATNRAVVTASLARLRDAQQDAAAAQLEQTSNLMLSGK